MIFNTHIHLDLQNANYDFNNSCIIPSIGKQNWDEVSKYNYFALGIHPWFVENHSEQDVIILEQNTQKLGPIAIGECGLDFAKNIDKNKQISFFIKQLDLAQKYNLAVVIHAVKSYDEIYNLLSKYQLKTQIHAFNGSAQQGQKLLDLGCYLSFGLYKKSLKLQNFIKTIPMDKILLETDEKPNDELAQVAIEIAKIKNIDLQELIKQNNKNCQKLFLI
jgi:TatD DNase family protein